MDKISTFTSKIKPLLDKYGEIIRYVIIGCLTTLVSLGSYYLLTRFLLDPHNAIQLQLANVISWVAAVCFAFFTNRSFVFKSTSNKKFAEFLKFASARVSTLCIDMLMMFVFVNLMGMNDAVAKLIVQVVVFILNYIFSKFLVFSKKSK